MKFSESKMKPILPDAPKVSIGIPLYRSNRFINIIIENIEVMLKEDIEILISDRHCLDDAIDILQNRFGYDERIRFFKSTDGFDWVYNLNFLMQEAKGKYWRFLPHDDTSPKGSLEALIKTLDDNPVAILAFGPTYAFDIDKNSIPEANRLYPIPSKAENHWSFELSLEMNWLYYFEHAFKGLIRRDILLKNNLYIRSTHNNILPERCWLFALCLLGRFAFVSDAKYIKRYYPDSTHRLWKISARTYYSIARCMTDYLLDFVKNPSARLYGIWDIWINAFRMACWLVIKKRSAQYYVSPDPIVFLHRQGILPSIPIINSWVRSRQKRLEDIRKMPLPNLDQTKLGN